jgi:hypothetical protein
MVRRRLAPGKHWNMAVHRHAREGRAIPDCNSWILACPNPNVVTSFRQVGTVAPVAARFS